MRTTTNLPDELYGEVRRRAMDQGRTVTSFLEQALRDAPARHDAGQKPPFVVRPFHGDGVMPGVDLTSNAAHAATAIEAGATWVTFDRDFARFPGLRWQVPAV